MKKFIYTLVAIVATSLTLSSCSSEPKDIILTPKSTSLRGELKEYFEVVDKEYILSETIFSKLISVELRKIKELPFDSSTTFSYNTSGQGVERQIGFGIKIFDQEDNIIEQSAPTGSGMNGPYSSEDVTNFLTIEVGETSIIRWSLDTEDEDVLKTLSTFEITSATEDTRKNASINWSDNTKSGSNGSSEWDSILNDYEEYVDDYIKVMKKANAGDMTALTDATSMLETAESLGEKLADAEDELSSTQLSRYMKITTKMTNAFF